MHDSSRPNSTFSQQNIPGAAAPMKLDLDTTKLEVTPALLFQAMGATSSGSSVAPHERLPDEGVPDITSPF